MSLLLPYNVYTQQHAELLISQDVLERKMSQMKFLIGFYEKTRFMLERDRIAEEFLQFACTDLGFVAGLALTFDSGESARLDAAVDLDNTTSVSKSVRRKFGAIPIGPGSATTLFLYDTENRAFPKLAEVYKAAGVAEPYNSAVIELCNESKMRMQLHLINWLHGPLFDSSTTELLQAMLRPLDSTFYTASLYESSITDELTQVKNRRYFQICVERDLELCRNKRNPISLILLDLDHFKKINDSFGHICGDEVLKNAALVLRSKLRQESTIARWGGEEFMILLPNVGRDDAERIAEKLREHMCEQTVSYPGGYIEYSASFGVSSFSDDCGSAQEFIGRSEEALNESKRRGRNRVTAHR